MRICEVCSSSLVKRPTENNNRFAKRSLCSIKCLKVKRAVPKYWRKLKHVWYSMKQRCFNTKNNSYKNYGAKGISISENWLNFDNFWADMNVTYFPGAMIDRINNTKNYSKENCKWSTRKEQNNNTNRNHMETYKGNIKTLAQWASDFNINYNTLCARIKKGWSFEKCLTKSLDKRGSYTRY